MKVLILSSPSDPHASAVHKYLLELNAEVDFLLIDQFHKSALQFNISNDARGCTAVREQRLLDFGSYASIWTRRPGPIAKDLAPISWVDNMVRQEIVDAFYGITHPLLCRWVNHPHRDQASSRKLWQLDVAVQVGLAIPETIVTNQHDVVREFFAKCKGRVIYKLISELSNQFVPSIEAPGISTYVLAERDLKYLDQVSYCPHLFQRNIDKAADVRVTIVGQRIFAVRIDSQAGKGNTDWRNDYSVGMDETELPSAVAESCLELMRKLRLNYGALDFCLDKEGNYVFIEINNAGQYLWQEMRLGLPISLELAKLLAHETPAITENPFD